MKIIKAYSGEDILVDDKDFNFLSKRKWFYTNRGNIKNKNIFCMKENKNYILMSRLITGCDIKEHVMYLDGNKLNHQRKNLVVLSLSEYRRLRAPRENMKYKGVSKYKDTHTKKYQTTITIKSKTIFIDGANSEIEAAQIYDASMDFFKFKYAYKNFPNEKFNLSKDVQKRIKKYETLL